MKRIKPQLWILIAVPLALAVDLDAPWRNFAAGACMALAVILARRWPA